MVFTIKPRMVRGAEDGEGREDGDGRKYKEKGEKAVSCGGDDEKIWLANVSEDRVIKSGRFRKIGH